MSGKPIIPEYIPPGVRNVDDDPRGRRAPPYNDASAPPGGPCPGCGGAAGGCAACWCPSCGAPPGYRRAGCGGCAVRAGFDDLVRDQQRAPRRRRLARPDRGPELVALVHRAVGDLLATGAADALAAADTFLRKTFGEASGRTMSLLLAETLSQATKPRRTTQKPVKVAISSRDRPIRPRRGGTPQKGGT